ncbi:MAG: right-handed parallel beta-helix repeat-containing protein [Clostridia bacterium]|nr:right-handed parallel beta-helix repeat-containing protein [Clostridia bacterium]
MDLKKLFGIVCSLILLAALFLFVCHAEEGGSPYLTTRAELMKALAAKEEIIFVGDIEFDESEIPVTINRSVRIVGKPEGSVFRRGHFRIEGPLVESGTITVSFENITFDGMFDRPEGNPEESASFASFYGDRSEKGCLTAKGFLSLSLSSCVFQNYCSGFGAAMYLQYSDGNADIGTRASLSLDGCVFQRNISEKGILWCQGTETNLKISNCSFTENQVFTGVLVLGGIRGELEAVSVKDNTRAAFREKNTFPGGGGGILIARSEAVIRNCLIEGNHTEKGGGLLSTASIVTIDSCRILNNVAETFGGGLALYSSEEAPVYVTNCLIRGNCAREEGAVWVGPADQIGIGLPTGIVEFSFCTIEGNDSEDSEHLLFHPVALEKEGDTVGPDGTVEFIGCVIQDEAVTPNLKNGENWNVVNDSESGTPVPAGIVKTVAGGYYAGQTQSRIPGFLYSEGGQNPGNSSWKLILLFSAVCAVLFAGLLVGLIAVRRRKEAHQPEKEGTAEDSETLQAGTEIPIPDESSLQAFTATYELTGRETDVLREYLSGKNRGEIARTLFISESTVKNHISSIFSKAKVKSRKELDGLMGRANPVSGAATGRSSQ